MLDAEILGVSVGLTLSHDEVRNGLKNSPTIRHESNSWAPVLQCRVEAISTIRETLTQLLQNDVSILDSLSD